MTEDDLLKLARDGHTVLVMCRSASEPLSPGAIRHYHCKCCGKEVQVSPTGRAQIIAGATTLCGTCGMAIIRMRKLHDMQTDLALTPMAAANLARKAAVGDADAIEILERVRNAEKEQGA